MISQIILRALSRAIEAIEEIGVEYTIFGGLALAAWKRLRSSLDIDVMVIIRKDAIDSLISSLQKKGFKLNKERPQVNLGEITLMSFSYPDEESLLDIKVDIAIASGGFPEKAVHNRIKLNVMGKDMWFVRCEDLILLKMLSGRPIDVVDAKELFRMNKEDINVGYLRKQALELNIEQQLRDVEDESK